MSKLLKILGAVAPTAATAFGGPMIGLATHTLGKILMGKEDASEDELTEFILANQNPEVLAQLRKADLELQAIAERNKIDFAEIAYKRERMHVDDRISARRMAIPGKARAQAYLSLGVLVIFVVMIGVLFMVEIPQGTEPVIYMLIGGIVSSLTQVMNFWFGSSSGSKEKERHIGDAVALASRMGMQARQAAAVDVEVEAEAVGSVKAG